MDSNNIGRPKVENPKNVDIKVRFDEKTNERILNHCDEKNTTKTNLIREGVKNQIALDNGLEQKDIEEYEVYLDKLKKNIKNFSLERVEKEISTLKIKLDELYGLINKLRDKYLDQEHGITYKEAFEKDITVSLPINANIFFVQKEYYETLMNLYDIRSKLKYGQ